MHEWAMQEWALSEKGNYYLINGGYLRVTMASKVRDGSYRYAVKYVGTFGDEDGEFMSNNIWYDSRGDAASAAERHVDRLCRPPEVIEPIASKSPPPRKGPRGGAGWQSTEV